MPLKYAVRDYFCPMCGHKEKHGTNHIGEIYCQCKRCKSSPLYCKEACFADLPFVEAVFHAFSFNFDNGEYKAWENLQSKLAAIGYKPFEVLVDYLTTVAEQEHNGQIVRLYKPNQLPDQFVSNIGRLHNWKLYIFPNPRIKAGYWLEKKV